ncbi:MAG: alpha-glucosidase C-terminal domain-containing protein [Ferruginibacter sp.]|nr:alpha-glucosidase C-terminal domain-containing protein [Ferruginibacter sp.]
MKKLIKIISFAIIIACCSPLLSTAQNTKLLIEQDPPQYGKPFREVPDRMDVTLYQVNIRTFSEKGNFNGVLARLDSIKALGANVVYLMPIYPVGLVKTSNSPYCVKDYKAVNGEFGTLEDLRAIVDGAHSRKMAVILDWVSNHTSFDNAWINNKSWYLQDSNNNIISPPGTGWNDVAQLNFSNANMRLAMINAMKYWVLTANVDGFRCDYSDGPPVDFWKQAIDTLRNIANHKLLLLAEGTRSANFGAGFDYNFGFRFFEELKEIYGSGHSVLSIDSLNVSDSKGASNGQQFIRYITNHDVNGSDGTPLELFGGEKGSMAAFVVSAYMNSVPMIYTGQEVGTPYRLVFPFTTKKVDWTINPGITSEYKKVIAFRNSSNAIRRGHLISFTTNDVCAFIKKSGKEEVLVISNLRNKPFDFALPSTVKNTTWKDVMKGGTVALNGRINLPPYSYLVFKK